MRARFDGDSLGLSVSSDYFTGVNMIHHFLFLFLLGDAVDVEESDKAGDIKIRFIFIVIFVCIYLFLVFSLSLSFVKQKFILLVSIP